MTSIANNGGRFCLSDGDRDSSSYSWPGGPTPTQIQRLKELHHNWRTQQQQDQDFMAFSTSTSMPFDQNHNNDQNEKQLHFGSTSSCSSFTNKEKSSHCDCGTNDDDFDAEIPLNLMMNLNLNKSSVPVEPEWEDQYEYEYEYDDVYLRQRKQAFKTIRSASQHSKAATNAFLRGDHVSAHQHSLKAHHQWLAAETLNAKAAKDILSIRRAHNDVWKLDLHGLQANEAVQVLHQHLHNIETKPSCKRSVSPNTLNMETRIRRSNRSSRLVLWRINNSRHS